MLLPLNFNKCFQLKKQQFNIGKIAEFVGSQQLIQLSLNIGKKKMDIQNLETHLKFVSAALGVTLNIEERLQLKLTLMKLQETQKLDEVLFWGKIQGVVKDYYIVLGINYQGHSEFPEKKFYWATNSFMFSPLTASRPEFVQISRKMGVFFTGEHEKVLKSLGKKDDSALLDLDSPDIDLSMPVKDFTELERLAAVVYQIEHDTHIVPKGAFKLTPIKEIRKNESFEGVAKDNMEKLEEYQHFREVESLSKREMLERNEGILQTDIFDTVNLDKPKGAWGIQKRCGNVVQLKSLLWPGYVFFHTGHTGLFCGAYFGDGIMNKDLPFMIQLIL